MLRGTLSSLCAGIQEQQPCPTATEIHRRTPGGDVLMHPMARMRLGSHKTHIVLRALSRTAKILMFAGFAQLWYSRRTVHEGGMFLMSPRVHFAQNRVLADWYFHLLNLRSAFTFTFVYQMKLPMGVDYDADELVTELARSYMLAWPRMGERYLRARDEPLDAFTDEQAVACEFRAPSGFDTAGQATGKQEAEAASVTEGDTRTGFWARWFGGAEVPAETVSADADVPAAFPGDCIGGYFVHRRSGTENKDARRRIGGTADDIGGRSIVLAPDPWEKQCMVLSAGSGQGYAIMRMTYVCVAFSFVFSAEGGCLLPPFTPRYGTLLGFLFTPSAGVLCAFIRGRPGPPQIMLHCYERAFVFPVNFFFSLLVDKTV